MTPTTSAPGAEAAGAEAALGARVCPVCGAENDHDDAYCTDCGGVLEPPQERPGGGRSRRRWLAVLVVALVAAIGASAALAVLWRGEVGHGRDLSGQLAAADTGLAAARKQLAATRAELRTASAIAQRRNAVLLRTQTVLTQVEPLLSTVDELQRYTVDIQGERDGFSASAGRLIDDLIALGNYLIQTDPAAIDTDYEQNLIDVVNEDLASVRSAEGTLHSFDSNYEGASSRFGRRADTFTKAVRSLQQQLKDVASP